MGDLHLNSFDLITIALVLISSIMAFARGFLREAFTIVAFAAGALAGLLGHHLLAPLVGSFIQPPTIAEFAAGIILFIIVFIIVTILTSFVAKSLHKSGEIGAIDRVIGLIFGAARGVLVMALLVLLADKVIVKERMPDFLTKARTYPALESVAKPAGDAIEVLIPKAEGYIKQKNATESAPAGTEPASAPTP